MSTAKSLPHKSEYWPRLSSFSYINPSSSPKRTLSHPPRGLSFQADPTASPLRRRILEASEALGNLPKRKRKAVDKTYQLEGGNPQKHEPSSKKKQRELTKHPVKNYTLSTDPIDRLELGPGPFTDEYKQPESANQPAISDSTLRRLNAYRFDDCTSRSEDATSEQKKDIRNLDVSFSGDTQVVEHFSDPAGSDSSGLDTEEDDVWYNIYNQYHPAGDATNSDKSAKADKAFEEAAHQAAVITTTNTAASGELRNQDTLAGDLGGNDLTISDDEFPMDEATLEEATNYVEQLDERVCRDENDKRLTGTPSSAKEWITENQNLDSWSDASVEGALLAELDAAEGSTIMSNPASYLGAHGSIPITPPPKQKQKQKEACIVPASFGATDRSSPTSTLSPQSPRDFFSTASSKTSKHTAQSSKLPAEAKRSASGPKSTTVCAADCSSSASKSSPAAPRSYKAPVTSPSPPQNSHAPLSPFVRRPFPSPMSTPSLLPSATSTTRLLTCFRTPEILKAMSSSSTSAISAPPASTPAGTPTMLYLEAYCLVTASSRPNPELQHFTFADLFFPATCPAVHGLYELWAGSELWECDTRAFLEETSLPKMCRAILMPVLEGTRIGKGRKESESLGAKQGDMIFEVKVLNIWEADWEDMRFVRGIVEA